MSKHPDLNGTALALLRALDRGEVLPPVTGPTTWQTDRERLSLAAFESKPWMSAWGRTRGRPGHWIEVGERLELRVIDHEEGAAPLKIRGFVVRLEELADPLESGDAGTLDDRFEIGVVFDLDWGAGSSDLLQFLEGVQRRPGRSTR